MAKYAVKLVNRADLHEGQMHGIEVAVQAKFDEVFDGTQDGVDVSWGAGDWNDDYVVHFVPDLDRSYLRQEWPNAVINQDAGGHTHSHNSCSGTEVYYSIQGAHFPYKGYAQTVVHESMHNLYPHQTTAFVHEMDGGGDAAGLAAARYNLRTPLTQHNKEIIRTGFSVKIPQYL